MIHLPADGSTRCHIASITRLFTFRPHPSHQEGRLDVNAMDLDATVIILANTSRADLYEFAQRLGDVLVR